MIWLVFDFLILLTATIWLLGLTLKGYLTVEQTVTFLILIVLFLGLSRIFKIGKGKLAFRIGIPIASLILFAYTYGQGDITQVTGILEKVLTLVIVLFGIYIMFVCPFRKRRK